MAKKGTSFLKPSAIKSLKKHGKKEQKLDLGGGSGFPAGIDYGKATVTSMKIGTYENGNAKGEQYFMVRGVCTAPKTCEAFSKKFEDGDVVETDLGTVDCVGLSDTIIMEPLHDTPTRKRKTEDEHMLFMVQVLQAFGISTDDLEGDEEEMNELFEAVVESGLGVKFRTWMGDPNEQYPNARVNVQFNGVDETEEDSSDDDDDDDDVDDDTDEDDSDDDEDPPEEDDDAEDDSEESSDDGDDLDSLQKKADDEDTDAQDKLAALAEAAGISDHEDDDKYPDWGTLVKAIRAADSDDDDEKEDLTPVKGSIYTFKPPKAKKAIEVSVTKLLKRAKTVDLKAVKGDRTYTKVPWSKLMDDGVPF